MSKSVALNYQSATVEEPADIDHDGVISKKSNMFTDGTSPEASAYPSLSHINHNNPQKTQLNAEAGVAFSSFSALEFSEKIAPASGSSPHTPSPFHKRRSSGTSSLRSNKTGVSAFRKKSLTDYRKNSAEFIFRTLNNCSPTSSRSPERAVSTNDTRVIGYVSPPITPSTSNSTFTPSARRARGMGRKTSGSGRSALTSVSPVCYGVRRKSLTSSVTSGLSSESAASSMNSTSGSNSLLSLAPSIISSNSKKSICEEICEEESTEERDEADECGEEMDTVSHTLSFNTYNPKRNYTGTGGAGKTPTVDRREDVLFATQPAWKCQQLRTDNDKPSSMIISPKSHKVSKMCTLSTITSLSHLFLRRGSVASAASMNSVTTKNDNSDLDFHDVIDSNIGDLATSDSRHFIPMGSLTSLFKKKEDNARSQDALQNEMEQHYNNIAAVLSRNNSNDSSKSSISSASPPTRALPVSRRHSMIRRLMHRLHLEKKVA